MFGEILLQLRRAASAAPASVLVKYGDVPGLVSSTQYCTASERETTMRAPHLQRGPSGRSSLGAPSSRTPCCFILESARVHMVSYRSLISKRFFAASFPFRSRRGIISTPLPNRASVTTSLSMRAT